MSENFNLIENKEEEQSFSYVVYDKIENFLHKMSSSSLLQIYYIANGNGFYIHHNDKYPLMAGNLLVVNPFEEFGFGTKDNSSMTFIGFGVAGLKVDIKEGSQTIVLKNIDPFIGVMVSHIYELIKGDEKERGLANSYFASLSKELSSLFVAERFKRPLTKEEIFVHKVKEYLDTHLLDRITIGSLSEQFYCSSSSLLHYFKNVEGVSVVEYVQRKRLELAKFFLRTGERKIADICVDVGFSSTQFFYSYFLKKEGVTPNEYRQLHKIDPTSK